MKRLGALALSVAILTGAATAAARTSLDTMTSPCGSRPTDLALTGSMPSD